MSAEAMYRKRQHESADYVRGLADQALQHITEIADGKALSLPAREQYYELICMELACRADACKP